MKANDMLKLCEYLVTFDNDLHEGIQIIANAKGELIVLDYFNELSVSEMFDLGCDWSPSMGGFRVMGE